MTIELPDEQQELLASRARARGLSPEEYVRQLLEHELLPPTVFEQGLGLFGSPEDTALLNEVVLIAYAERHRVGKQSPTF